jgi:hypothetical protein
MLSYSRCERSLGAYWCSGAACIDVNNQRKAQWEHCMRAEGWTPYASRGFDTSGHTFAP